MAQLTQTVESGVITGPPGDTCFHAKAAVGAAASGACSSYKQLAQGLPTSDAPASPPPYLQASSWPPQLGRCVKSPCGGSCLSWRRASCWRPLLLVGCHT